MTAIATEEVVSPVEATSSDTLDHAFCAECFPPPYEAHDVLVSLCGRLRDDEQIGSVVQAACVVCYSTKRCSRCGSEF